MTRRLSRIPKMMPPRGERKPGRLRDRAHLDWLKTLCCLGCGRRGPCDPAHLRFNEAHPVHKGAAGLQPPDDLAVPLCRVCHNEEETGKQTFWATRMDMGVTDPIGVAGQLRRVSGDTDKGLRAIAHARRGLPTSSIAA